MNETFTYKANSQPIFMWLPDIMERILNIWGISLVDYSVKTCVRKAQKITGLTSFGMPDFHEPLEILIKSCQEDARLNFAGKFFVRTMIITSLINRLKIENDIAKHPEIIERPVRKPLIIIGLPRTGTTLLHNLLAQDPNARFLRCWEAMSPSPPPSAETDKRDWRILKAKFLLGLKKFISPQMAIVKPIDAVSAEECIILLGHTFMSYRAFSIFLNNPQYLKWLKNQDLTKAYEFYYRILQLLQWRYTKKHWVLKAPEHLINIEPLLNVFPDACCVQTHRNLLSSVPSSSSMMAVFRGSYSASIDLKDIGKDTLQWMTEAVENAMSVRKKLDRNRFFDVHYRDLIHDPVGTVHKIYTHFDYPCSAEMDQRMSAWLKKHPRHPKGVHRYSLAQFDLSDSEINRNFKNYYDAHQVTIT